MQPNSLYQQIKDLISKYNLLLAEKGIECTVFRKYIESGVESVPPYNSTGIDNLFLMHEEKKYKGQKNRYYFVIIRFSPLDKKLIKKSECKEYAYIVRRIERMHIGLKPKEYISSTNRLLKRIEKRLQKILDKAQTQSLLKTCKDNLADFFRYFFCLQYKHKHILLGKSRSFWDKVAIIIVIITIILFTFLYCLFYNL